MGMGPCCDSEERDVSSFYYDFEDLFREALGKYEKMPMKAGDQAKVFLRLMKFLTSETPDELIAKVYELKGKLEKAKALNQDPLDEFGGALKELDTQKKEVQDPVKEAEDKSEDDGDMDMDEEY